jgi:hypothetical protein
MKKSAHNLILLAAAVAFVTNAGATITNTPYTAAANGLWHLNGDFTAAVGDNGAVSGTGTFRDNNGAFAQNFQVGASAGGFTGGIVQGADFAGTIDMNVYYTGATSGFLWQLNTAGGGQDLMHVVVHSANGELLLQQYNGVTSDWDSVWSTSAAAALTLNTWHNIALSWNRYAGTAEFFVDGNSVGGSGSLGSFSGFTMGSITVAGAAPWGDAWSVKNVNIDEVRVSLGTLESDFTIVTNAAPAPLPSISNQPYTTAANGLWHLDDNYNATVGTNGTATGSPTFAAQSSPVWGSFLSAGASPAGFDAGIVPGGTFVGSVDMNIYLNSLGSTGRTLLTLKNSAGSAVGFLVLGPDGTLGFQLYNGNGGVWENIDTGAGAVTTNRWYNVAAVWNRFATPGTMSIRINNYQVASAVGLGEFGQFGVDRVSVGTGPWSGGGNWFFTDGAMDEVRVTLGSMESSFALVGPPYLISADRAGNNLNLTWTGPGGTTNVVQAASSLGAADVVDISSAIVLSGGATVTNTYTEVNGGTNSARFYRIRQLP